MPLRIIPFLAVLFVMMDRLNVGFAKLQMVKDLGFSEAVYGFGAGIVYLGYKYLCVRAECKIDQ